MNRPARIHFHPDSGPRLNELPDRYLAGAETLSGLGVRSLLVQHAFYIDFAPQTVRTRATSRDDNPIDFQLDSICFIEWYYHDTPHPLVPHEQVPRRSRDDE